MVSDNYSYSSDYEVIGKLKQFADRHGVCILIVHHTRKQPAGDSFEKISGTTGLSGCADGALIMQKEKRTDGKATLEISGRDQPDQRLYLSKDQESLVGVSTMQRMSFGSSLRTRYWKLWRRSYLLITENGKAVPLSWPRRFKRIWQ